MPSRRFLLALAASLALHLTVLGARLPDAKVWRRGTAPAALNARLLPPVAVTPAESLLKNTLAEQDAPQPAPPTSPPPPKPADAKHRAPNRAAPRSSAAAAQAAAQRKLSKMDFYPPEAIAQGIEGEARLLLILDADGVIRDIQIAASSGHAILDRAAVKAASALGRLPESDRREMILPVVFKLR